MKLRSKKCLAGYITNKNISTLARLAKAQLNKTMLNAVKRLIIKHSCILLYQVTCVAKTLYNLKYMHERIPKCKAMLHSICRNRRVIFQ